MFNTNSVVAIYDTHEQAEKALKELQEAGVDMKSLSIAAKDTHTDEQVVGYYNSHAALRTRSRLFRLNLRVHGQVSLLDGIERGTGFLNKIISSPGHGSGLLLILVRLARKSCALLDTLIPAIAHPRNYGELPDLDCRDREWLITPWPRTDHRFWKKMSVDRECRREQN